MNTSQEGESASSPPPLDVKALSASVLTELSAAWQCKLPPIPHVDCSADERSATQKSQNLEKQQRDIMRLLSCFTPPAPMPGAAAEAGSEWPGPTATALQRSGEEGRGGVEMHDYVNVPRLKSDKIRHSLPRSLSHSVTRITRQRPRSVPYRPSPYGFWMDG